MTVLMVKDHPDNNHHFLSFEAFNVNFKLKRLEFFRVL